MTSVKYGYIIRLQKVNMGILSIRFVRITNEDPIAIKQWEEPIEVDYAVLCRVTTSFFLFAEKRKGGGKMQTPKQFQTIRQAAAALGVPEFRIRAWVKQGNVPGFWSGTRFYVNVPAFHDNLAGRYANGGSECK